MSPGGRLLAVLLLAFFSGALAQPREERWESDAVPRMDREISTYSAFNQTHDLIIADFDDDGEEELCELRTDVNHPLFLAIREIDVAGYSYPGRVPEIRKSDERLYPLTTADRLRFATYRFQNGQAWFDLYDHKGERVDSLATLGGRDLSADGVWNGRPRDFYLHDLNGDLRPDMVLTFNTGADEEPRALVAYDLAEKRPLLEKRFAPMVTSLQIADLDGDGRGELILALAGASDGPQFGEFRRDSSYIAMLSPDGRLLAQRSFGGESSYACFSLMRGGGRTNLLAAAYTLVGDRQSPQLYLLDGRTLAIIAALEDYGELDQIDYIVKQGRGEKAREEIVVLDLGHRAAMLRLDLAGKKIEIVRTIVAGGKITFILADDVDQDGENELFFTTQNPPILWLTDGELHPLAWMPIGQYAERVVLTPLARGAGIGRRYILLDNGILKRMVLNLQTIRNPNSAIFSLRGRSLTLHPLVIILLTIVPLLLLGGVVAYALRQRRWSAGLAENYHSNRIGQAFVDEQGVVTQCNPLFLRLLGMEQARVLWHPILEVMAVANLQSLHLLVQNYISRKEIYLQQEIDITTDGRPHHLAVELTRNPAMPLQMVVLLVDLSESLQRERLKIWAAMALRMAHKTKTPLATVLLAIQRLQRAYRKHTPELAPEYEELSRTAIREIERVRDNINTFMKFAKLDPPSFLADDLSRVVQECLQEYLPRTPDDVQVRTQFENDELPVNIDISQFKEALFNILDNAITAIRGDGMISLTTLREKNPLYQSAERDMALLEISDNGEGIGASEMALLFSPGFSTSPAGTGMGLVLARSIIEAHSGTIEIDSRRNAGTAVYIRLPIMKGIRKG